MRAVAQRVNHASVSVEGESTRATGRGLMLLIGISGEDTIEDVSWMADKILNLRIFSDENRKMNLSILDVRGEILAVSQFTLYGDCRKGRRPGFPEAAPPEKALPFFDACVEKLKASGLTVKTGTFGAHMRVTLENDGPATLLLDSKAKGDTP